MKVTGALIIAAVQEWQRKYFLMFYFYIHCFTFLHNAGCWNSSLKNQIKPKAN